MKHSLKTLALCGALSTLLVACGGGTSDPDPSNRSGLLTVSAASNATLNGVYSSNAVGLTKVETIPRVGATDACEFSYDKMVKTTDSTVSAAGRIRYIKDATTLQEYSISINGSAFARADGGSTSVDRAGNVIMFNGAVVPADTGTATLTLTGNVPIPFSRPAGC
jgi:hypothetical protein